MENNQPDFSFLNQKDILSNVQTSPVITKIADNVQKSYLSNINKDSLYSAENINNLGVDNRKGVTDYTTPFLDVYVPLNSGEYVARFKDYQPGVNNEERLAQQQTSGEKLLNGLEKFVAKTGTAILGGTIGVADSIFTGIKEGSMSAAYNSNFNKWLDDLNTKLDYKLPNYYSEEEKNKSFFGELGTTNFWADKVLGGLSFTIGAVGSEAIWASITGGTSLLASEGILARSGRWATDLFTTAETKGALASWKSIATKPIIDSATEQALNQTLKTGAKVANGLKALDTTRFFLTSAGFEAGVEARQYLKQTEEDWTNMFTSQNGREPSAQEKAEFKDKLTTAGNWVFLANLAIVGSENMMTIGKLTMGKSIRPELPNSWLDRNVFGVGFKKGTGSALEAIEATTKQKIAGRAFGVLKMGASEGLYEEGMQNVAQQTMSNYVLSGYDQKKLETNYGFLESLADGFKESYGTKAGAENIGIGVLVGLLGGGISSLAAGEGLFNEKGVQREQVKKAVDYYNEFHADNLIELQKSQARTAGLSEKSDIAKAKGNLLGEIHADREAVLSVIERQHGMMTLDGSKEQYKVAMDLVPEADLSKELGISTEEVKAWKVHKVEEFNTMADTYSKNAKYVDALLGSENIKEFKNKEIVSRALAYTLTMGNFSQKDERNITNTIAKLVGEEYAKPEIIQAIHTDLILDKAGEELTNQYNSLNKSQKALQAKEKALLNQAVKIQNLSNDAQNINKAQKAESNRVELIKTQEELQKVLQQKQVVADSINLKNNTGDVLTTEMLDTQQENLVKLQKTIDVIKENNLQKHALLQKLIVAQSKAIEATKSFDTLAREITDSKTRFTVVRGLLDKITKARKGKDELTFFQDSIKQYSKVSDLEVGKLAEEVKELKPGVETLEENKQRVSSEIESIQTESDQTTSQEEPLTSTQEKISRLKDKMTLAKKEQLIKEILQELENNNIITTEGC